MKNVVFAALVLSASLAITASGQVKSVAVANNRPSSTTATRNQTPGQISSNATRASVISQDSEAVQAPRIIGSGTISTRQKWDFKNHAEAARFRPANASSGSAIDSSNKTTPAVSPDDSPDNSKPDPAKPKSPTTTAALSNTVAGVASTIATAPTQLYRVGIRDVLDIQLSDYSGGNSTLFTVLEGGVLEYPLAGDAIVVGGLTPPEIAALLRQRIKIFENPAVAVTVRDFASHAVTIGGFVAAPGTKILRREAVPLYTVLAEALIFPEAARATITRPGGEPVVVDLKDANVSAMLVVPGDTIKVSGPPSGPTEFYFVGGEIGSPGEKPYHAGLTLTQAILASGGSNSSAGSKVRVSRQGPDGRLNTEEYNLRKIQTGKAPDPVLQNGDRIEVTTAN